MAAVDVRTVLELVKARLNRLPEDTSLDDYLLARCEGAIRELADTGITLTDSTQDTLLAVDYAVWQYQCRDSQTGMPDWLRLRRREYFLRERRRQA